MSTEKWKSEHVEEMRAYRRKHYRKNRRHYIKRVAERRESLKIFVAKLKSKLKCSRCPESDSRCLDFHHLDPSKKTISISRAWMSGCSIKTILKEIKKCIVLCSNCHRKEHAS